MEIKRASEILRMELPCYDSCPCSSRVTCEECEFQAAVDLAVACMEEVGEIIEELLELSEMDCYGEYQEGRRAGLVKAYEVVRKVVEGK